MINYRTIHERLAVLAHEITPPAVTQPADPSAPESDDDIDDPDNQTETESDDDETAEFSYRDHYALTRRIEARTAVANARLAEAKANLAEAAAVAAHAANVAPPAAPPAPAASLCRHVMPSGRRCRAVRHNQTLYCFFHDKHRHRVRNRASLPPAFNLSHLPLLEDRASLQIALDETIRGFINGTINDRKTGLLLYGLQIAFQNVRSLDKDMISADSLASSTSDDEDDDLPLAPLTDDEQQLPDPEGASGAKAPAN
jgi:hypothetical protein